MRVRRKKTVDLLDRTDTGRERASVVVAVKRVEQGAVLAYQRDFGRGRAGIDTEITVALVGRDITGRDMVVAMTV